MNIEKLKELLQDDAFVKTLNKLVTLEEVQAALAERGVDMTLEEMHGVFCARNGELSETDLENAMGGTMSNWMICPERYFKPERYNPR